LHPDNTDVVRVALRIVIKLGSEAKEVVPALIQLLDHPRAELRWMACIGFRQIGADGAAAAGKLASLLKDPDSDVRSRAAQALSRMGAASEHALKTALEGSDPAWRAAAADVLRDLRARGLAQEPSTEPAARPDLAATERARWYNEAKFGIFIHWGLYAVPHRARPGQLAEWVMDNEKIPVPEYEKFASGFTAARFDADAWAKLVKETGAKYMVLTSKHHDGFCLWDTQSTRYNAAQFSPAGRDLIAQLAPAAERAGVKLALYYSFLDWHQPDYEKDFPKYVDWMHGQIRELLTRYPIWGLWFDGEWTHSKAEWRGDEVLAMIRQLRPLAFVNDRIGRETRGTMRGVDFYTKEQEIPAAALRVQNRPVAWETCQTFGYSWGYNESPDALRTGERIIEELVEVVSKGGNFLLNIGPRPDGSIPEFFQERMAVIGQFMRKNGDAIYGTERSPFGGPLPAGRVTAKGNMLYIFLEQLPQSGITMPGLASEVKRAWLLESKQPLEVRRENGVPVLAAPKALSGPVFTVVAVELDGPPR
jgi:alpha-L-fucosidase